MASWEAVPTVAAQLARQAITMTGTIVAGAAALAAVEVVVTSAARATVAPTKAATAPPPRATPVCPKGQSSGGGATTCSTYTHLLLQAGAIESINAHSFILHLLTPILSFF